MVNGSKKKRPENIRRIGRVNKKYLSNFLDALSRQPRIKWIDSESDRFIFKLRGSVRIGLYAYVISTDEGKIFWSVSLPEWADPNEVLPSSEFTNSIFRNKKGTHHSNGKIVQKKCDVCSSKKDLSLFRKRLLCGACLLSDNTPENDRIDLEMRKRSGYYEYKSSWDF